MIKEIYPEYSFGENEHVPSTKWNSILMIVEETRKFVGPFAISKLTSTGAAWQPTATSYFLQLEDNPWEIGGVNTNVTPPVTLKKFQVFHYNGTDSLSNGFARWDNMIFTSGTIESSTKWYMTLSAATVTTGRIGTGYLVLSGLSISGFSCFRMSG